MTALTLSPVEQPAVLRALTGASEDLDFLAVQRQRKAGSALPDRETSEMREEAEVLRGVVARLAGDQSPAPSRALVRALLSRLDDEVLRVVIDTAEAQLDARFLESQRARPREVAARYCGAKR